MAAAGDRATGTVDFGIMPPDVRDHLLPFLGSQSAAALSATGKVARLTSRELFLSAAPDEKFALVQRISPERIATITMPDEVLFVYGTDAQKEAFLRERPEAYLEQAIQLPYRFYREREQLMPIFAGLSPAKQQKLFSRMGTVGLIIFSRPPEERQHITPDLVFRWFERKIAKGSFGDGEFLGEERQVAIARVVAAFPEEQRRQMMGSFPEEARGELLRLAPELAEIVPDPEGGARLDAHFRRLADEYGREMEELKTSVQTGEISCREFRKRVGPYLSSMRFWDALDLPAQHYYVLNAIYAEQWDILGSAHQRLAFLGQHTELLRRYPELRDLYSRRVPREMLDEDREAIEFAERVAAAERLQAVRAEDMPMVRVNRDGDDWSLAYVIAVLLIGIWMGGVFGIFDIRGFLRDNT